MENPFIEEIVGINRDSEDFYCTKKKKKYIEANYSLDRYIQVSSLIRDFLPTHILNFAAISTSSSPALDLFDNNTAITLNLLESCAQLNHKVNFFQASSLSVENIPLNVYAVSKLACENLVEGYSQVYPELINGFSCRFPAVVGSNNKHGLLKDIVSKLKAPGNTITLFGEAPGSRKPFIYGKNLAEILNYLMFTSEHWEWSTLKIAPTDSLTVQKVARIAMDKLNIHKEIVWDKNRVWRGDQEIVFPSAPRNYFDGQVLSSESAIRAALEDIIAN